MTIIVESMGILSVELNFRRRIYSEVHLLAKLFQNIESKSAISLPKHFTNGSRKFYRTVIYEETDSEKVARDVHLPPVHQTDPEQLARQVNLPHFGDNALVLDQKEPRDDVVAV
jgi:hypothetical protein